MHEDNTEGPGLHRGNDLHGRPIDEDRADVFRIESGENAHQRRLAGAVLADQPVHLAREDLEVNVVDRERGAKALGNSLKSDDRTVRCSSGSGFQDRHGGHQRAPRRLGHRSAPSPIDHLTNKPTPRRRPQALKQLTPGAENCLQLDLH
jgi:hypothetical protein